MDREQSLGGMTESRQSLSRQSRCRINPVRRWLIGLLYAAPAEVYLELLRENTRLHGQIADVRKAVERG